MDTVTSEPGLLSWEGEPTSSLLLKAQARLALAITTVYGARTYVQGCEGGRHRCFDEDETEATTMPFVLGARDWVLPAASKASPRLRVPSKLTPQL